MMFINLFYWCTNQLIVQRSFGASSFAEAQKGVIATAALKLLGPFYLVFPGIIALEMFGAAAIGNGDMAYARLVDAVLPGWMVGFFAAVLLGAIVSSFNGGLHSAATLFSLDLYRAMLRRDADERQMLRAGKIFAVVVCVLTVLSCPLLGGAPEGVFTLMKRLMAAFKLPLLAVVMAGILSPRVPAWSAKTALIGGVGTHFLLEWLFGHGRAGVTIHWLHLSAINVVMLCAFMLIASRFARGESRGDCCPRRPRNAVRKRASAELKPWSGLPAASIAVAAAAIALLSLLWLVARSHSTAHMHEVPTEHTENTEAKSGFRAFRCVPWAAESLMPGIRVRVIRGLSSYSHAETPGHPLSDRYAGRELRRLLPAGSRARHAEHRSARRGRRAFQRGVHVLARFAGPRAPRCSPACIRIVMASSANDMAPHLDVPTLGQRLQAAGFATGYIGKWHLDGSDYFGDGRCPAGWDESIGSMGETISSRCRTTRRARCRGACWVRRTSRRTASRRSSRTPIGRRIARSTSFANTASATSSSWCRSTSRITRGFARSRSSSAFEDFEFPVPNADDPLDDKPRSQREWAAHTARLGSSHAAPRRAGVAPSSAAFWLQQLLGFAGGPRARGR